MAQSPADYLLVGDSSTATRWKQAEPRAFLIGKPGEPLGQPYDIPNSPTLTLGQDLLHRVVVHRTAAGARGVLSAIHADEILVAGFVNAAATVAYIRDRDPEVLSLVCMGHEGTASAAEDELCAAYIASTLRTERFARANQIRALRWTSGAYFFGEAQDEYPAADFERCLAIDRFDFALRAERHADYARLRMLDV